MNLNRNNYEAYLIDYLDGSLSIEERRMVEQFLLIHPDIQAEFDDLTMGALPNEEVSFHAKDSLKMGDSLPDTTSWMLQALDGTLTEPNRTHLQNALQNPEIAKEFELLKLSFLSPLEMTYAFKNDLHIPNHLTPLQEEQLISDEQLTSLQPSVQRFSHKSELYFAETLNLKDPTMWVAAYAEGDLMGAELRKAQKEAAALPDFANQADALRKMRLIAPAMLYEQKEELKQKETRVLVLTPIIKRAMAVAAVFVMGLSIWQPWQEEGALRMDPTAQKAPSQTGVNQESPTESKDLAMDQKGTTDSVVAPRTPANRRAKNAIEFPLDREEAIVMDQIPLELPAQEENPQQMPSLQAPLFASPSADAQLAQLEPLPAAPDVSSSQLKAIPEAATEEPVSLIGFIGNKLEDRMEQSPVYAFFDKKKKEIFESKDQNEPIRYQRISTVEGVKHKLVLWGIEFQRNKRKK